MKKTLSQELQQELLKELKARFEKNTHRHKGMDWTKVQAKLEASPGKLWTLNEMEITDGEPDVIAYDKKTDEYLFVDCSPESPKRRSYCYDRQAWEERKEAKPENNVIDAAAEMGVELLDETLYRQLQALGPVDQKTSSWLITPPEIRKHGGAIFGDYRYGTVFIYHNGVQSYYAARGFRGALRV